MRAVEHIVSADASQRHGAAAVLLQCLLQNVSKLMRATRGRGIGYQMASRSKIVAQRSERLGQLRQGVAIFARRRTASLSVAIRIFPTHNQPLISIVVWPAPGVRTGITPRGGGGLARGQLARAKVYPGVCTAVGEVSRPTSSMCDG